MRYRVYSGPDGLVRPIDKDRMPFKEFGTLEEALIGARRVAQTGHVAQLIEGDDGTRLGRDEIAAAINHPDVRGVAAGRVA